MSERNIEVNITTADANSNVDVGPEKGELKTIIVSGTFTAGSITLECRRKRGWAPVSGGVFTQAQAYSNRITNVTAYRAVVSSDFQGDVYLEIG